MNKIQVIGNITRDAVINETNGRKAINFRIAINESFKNKDAVKVEKTTYYSCTLWRSALESTEVVKYLLKGVKVYVEGTPSAEMYKGKDNVTSIDLRINVNPFKGLELLSSVKKDETENTDATNNNQTQQAMQPNESFMGVVSDDVPF